MGLSHCAMLLPSLCLLLLAAASALAETRSDKPPQIVKKLEKRIELKFGYVNRFVLECVADASPAPSYQWFRNGEPLSPDTAGLKLVSDDDHSQLDFVNPSSEHEGYYHCEAVNPLGKARSVVTHVTPTLVRPPPGTKPPR